MEEWRLRHTIQRWQVLAAEFMCVVKREGFGMHYAKSTIETMDACDIHSVSVPQ